MHDRTYAKNVLRNFRRKTMNARYEINKIINNQKSVSTSKLKKLFELYEEQGRGRDNRYKDRITKLETTITNQRRELRKLRGN